MAMEQSDEQLRTDMARHNWLILVILVAVSLIWQSPSLTLGIVCGGLLAIFNFRWLGRSLTKTLDDPRYGIHRSFLRTSIFRLIFIACALYLLLARIELHPIGVAVGLSVVIINIFVITLKRLY